MNQDTTIRRLHARVFARRRGAHSNFLLDERDFRFAADCERMRVDRNGSTLSLLLIRLPRHKRAVTDVNLISRILEGRLRTTDTPGQLNDGRIAILLPDTPAEGAWKVAEDISEVYPPGADRPECEVLAYPPRERRDSTMEGELDAAKIDTPATEENSESSSEFFFSTPTSWIKRSIDIVGACVGLAVAAPIITVAAIAIKSTSPGPVFFGQEREGRGGRKFRMWKLRTMCVDADEQKDQLLTQSEQDGPAFKMRRDPRTTGVGRLLRWTSFDELPQFWNILKGEMSLVGPRPLPTRESQACETWQRRRLTVTPGLTCTWQVTARGKVRFDDWVRMDLQYVKHQTLWQDVLLLLWTVPSIILNRGIR